jgi:hypothetical protein
MTATNHALAGAVVALIVKEPVLAVPLALASHFALDILPHFGMHSWEERRKHPLMFKNYFVVEAAALIGLILIFWLARAPALVYLCSLVAMSPDFAWGYRFIVQERLGSKRPAKRNRFNQWHSDIQTRESIFPGMYIEFGAAAFLLAITIWLL